MANWDSQKPEVTRNLDKTGLSLLKQAGDTIANGESYDFGVAVIDAAWKGEGVTDRASLTISGSIVAVLENEAGTVDGTIYAWVKDFIV
jgi:hypothetical protein